VLVEWVVEQVERRQEGGDRIALPGIDGMAANDGAAHRRSRIIELVDHTARP
jgi:hypothetical protein